MQAILSYSLIILSLIGIVYLMNRDRSTRQVIHQLKEIENRLHEQNKRLMMEMVSLKKQVGEMDEKLARVIQQMQSIPVEPTVPPKESIESETSEHLFLNDRYKEIFELKEQGLSTEQIAKQLGRGYGEIAFILELANKKE
ncbi:MAG TPA: hypothetical protein VJ824_07745 [Bacillota bacterium]|nr:hypothetical protein [Bacillota bacterium]